MNSVFILAAALSTSALVPLSVASNKEPAIGFSVRSVMVNQGRDTIKPGTTLMTVLRLMGSLHEDLSPHVWVYHGFQADDVDLANKLGCDTLLITFAQGKVANMELVNDHAVNVIASNLKLRQAERYASKE
ncbi:MAG TPA: hypothetical protein VLW52_03560 [Opitutaceae bacterium]|nr:hypothetical protein [Opitutaceae bacterium]